MKHVTAILFCLLTVAAMAAENHVRCIEPYSPSREEPAPYYDLSRVTTSYFDGLGRLIESVDEGAGGDFENVYALTVYGRGGEVMQKWQPVGLHSGFVAAPMLKSVAQSFYGCSNTYAALFYDLSEDVRASATVRPGAEARTITEHDLCYDGEIPMFFANASGKLERKGHYAEGSLLLKASTDESLLTRYTYTDFSGRKVAEMAGDAWTFWGYDVCGRIVADKLRHIKEIRYNDNHLPQSITMDNGNVLRLGYDADGEKESETRSVRLANGRMGTTRRDYYGAVQRVGGVTERVEWDGGFFIKGSDGQWNSYRYVRNTLGSIVAVADSAGQIVQAVDYHVTGLPVVYAKSKEPVTRRMHAGKEFVEFEGLSLYDNGARYYTPDGMRFLTPDPLALNYPDLSPYVYCGNNPANYLDPDGKDIYEIGTDGRITKVIKDKNYDAFNISNADGQNVGSFKMDYGSILTYDQRVASNGDNYSIFSVGNDWVGNSLFEFLAINTNVEWSLLLTGENTSSGQASIYYNVI